MPDCAVFDAIATATESLADELFNRLQPMSFWNNAIPKTEFKQNSGLEQTTFEAGAIEPSESTEWIAESLVSEENVEGACLLPTNNLDWGYNSRVFAPEKTRIFGPLLCKDNFTYQHIPGTFITNYVGKMAEVTDLTWSYRLQEHYSSNTPKYIAGPGEIVPGQTLPPGQLHATLPNIEASSELTQDMLDDIATRLDETGAASQADPTQWGFFDYGPMGSLYTLLISAEASRKIMRNDPENVAILQYSDMGKGENAILRSRLGAAKTLFNFKHVINRRPPRFNWDGTTYVRVPQYITVPGTGKGFISVINPDWQNAEFEEAFVIHPLVINQQVVRPETNPGGLPFSPSNYMGEWDFITGAYRLGLDCDDPKDKFGRHIAEFRHAIEPIHPDYGMSIIYSRCTNSPFLAPCS